MSLPYTVLGELTGSIESGSYLDTQDTPLFYVSQSNDSWFGYSSNDAIEISAYSTDSDNDLLGWGTINQNTQYQTITLSYIDDLNNIESYSYNELISLFTIYRNKEILLQPFSDLSSIGITNGSCVVSYNFIREMAGSPSSSLSIKEISTSRTEVKLIPSVAADIQYNSFIVKKFPIKDVSPVLLSDVIKNLSYDEIYETMSSMQTYQNGINFLKFVFFLPNDAAVINFLKNLYEDYIKYTSVILSNNIESSTVTRIQGIKSYYNNFLLQNYDLIVNFDDIRQQYIGFVNERLDEVFFQFLTSNDSGYQSARQFCYDFFVTYFYDNSVNSLKLSYNDKYFSYFKNVLNFGNNKYFFILDHGYIDERQSPGDALTLVVKLSSALPSDINEKDNCWVSNFGMVPYIFTSIIQNPVIYQTVQISPPNFDAPQKFINKGNSNIMYSSNDLVNSSNISNLISLNKKITELNVDYSDFSNFIIFSSAQNRLNIFKNKMIQLTLLSASLSELNNLYNNSLSSSVPYPYFFSEQSNLNSKISILMDSFDGYESYLFNGGNYQYIVSSGSFYSSSYVSSQDINAKEYDINNRDSLIANTPQYIITNSDYQDYLTFLNMIGHHFDNIYTYISALPIERQLKNELTSSIPTNTLKEMLYSFGWDVDDIINSLDIDQVYLNSMDSASYNVLSGQQRLQTIWNRILVNLPGIYKSKGTIECVNFLMACYGLPSSMITIREYGGTDSSADTSPTYQLDEKMYMLTFSGVGDYVEGPIPNSTETVEFKFSIGSDPNKTLYPEYEFFPLFTSIPYPYTSSIYSNWMMGFYRVPGNYSGRVVFQMGSGSSGAAISSSIIPIFNGDIFSVMLRKNKPYNLFEFAYIGAGGHEEVVPLQYDLVVQRNEDGRTIFYSTSSAIINDDDNNIFAQWGRFRLTDGTFQGTLDKVSIWNTPIDDDDFNEHVDDLNSYGYSGSIPFENLWVRLNWDYPQNMYYNISGSSVVWIDNQSPYYFISNYYTDQTLTTINPVLYSSSLEVIQQRWSTYYPTGSVEILAYNFPVAIGSAFSASWMDYPVCMWVSQSIYPYHFEELTYEQNIDASKYGPNKYKNKKIRTVDYQIDTRFDPSNRSTYESDVTISGESNQLGFFIDPQDSKNKDILRYIGKNGIMQLIADPSNLFSDKYYDLRNKNVQYNLNGNKRTYFNELITVYKFYFDKSIFKTIKNIIPARANLYTGVVIEPTLLERPKYQNKPITSSVEVSYKHPAVIDHFYKFDERSLWADFNTDWSLINTGSNPPYFTTYEQLLTYYQTTVPQVNISNINKIPTLQQTPLQISMSNSVLSNYEMILDFEYLSDPIVNKPINLMGSGYITDYMDKIQHNFYPDLETLPRNWEVFTTPIYGSVSSQNKQGRFMVSPDHGVVDTTKYFSGSNKGNHPIVYYMMKIWEKYDYNVQTGEYVRSTNVYGNGNNIYNYNAKENYFYSGSVIRIDNPNVNVYSSASVWLYKYGIFDEYFMRTQIYFTDLIYLSVYNPSDLSYTYNSYYNSYLHKANTFLGTPDQMVNNVFGIPNGYTPFEKTNFDLILNNSNQYFEIVSGYPRNHYTHKMKQFSKSKYGSSNLGIFVKGRQTSDTTINTYGINDGSIPVQSSETSNINIVNSSNIIQNVISVSSGQTTPNSGN